MGLDLIVVTAYPPFTGHEAQILPEARALSAKGVGITIVPRSFRRKSEGNAGSTVPSVIALPLVNEEILFAAAKVTLTSPLKVLRTAGLLFKSRTLNIFLKNLAVFPKGLWLGELASRLNIKHIHAHWGSTTATLAMIAHRVSGIPWSFTVHRWDIAENNLLKQKVRDSVFVRAVSSRGGCELADLGCDLSKIVVLHMGVDLPHGSAPVKPAKVLRLVCAANFAPEKDHRTLLRAISLLKSKGISVQLTLCGDGPLANRIRRSVATLELDADVVFEGRVDHHTLLGMLRNGVWDVAVLSSNIEGIPVFLMEAMAAGIPVVATRVGAVQELCTETCSVLVSPSVESVAYGIRRVYQSVSLRRELRKNGRRRVESQFNIDQVASSLKELFESRCA